MKVKDIFSNLHTKVFVVTDRESNNLLDWSIDPTTFALIPEEENMYIVKAFQVSENRMVDCFIGISMPERIVETIIKSGEDGQILAGNSVKQEWNIIPAVAAEGFGNYELFYAKENPHIGIDVLRDGLNQASNKSAVAEDLGYILRDEGRIEEAIEAFRISEQYAPSSEYIYAELAGLFKEAGQVALQAAYEQKFKDAGGIE